MFTVLVKDNYGEEVFAAHSVKRISVEDDRVGFTGRGLGVLIEFGRHGEGGSVHYGESGDQSREVFVMNGNGATVARYHL